jgi:hypothetical protein
MTTRLLSGAVRRLRGYSCSSSRCRVCRNKGAAMREVVILALLCGMILITAAAAVVIHFMQ